MKALGPSGKKGKKVAQQPTAKVGRLGEEKKSGKSRGTNLLGTKTKGKKP